MNNKGTKNTSWGRVASWYDDLLETGGSYQKDVILPDLLALLSIKEGDRVLDLACGQGFFTRAFRDEGAGQVIGVDTSHELIDIAKNYEKSHINRKVEPSKGEVVYFVAPAHKLGFLEASSIDKITIILSLQNISNVLDVLKECHRVIKEDGFLVIVLNHPAFRIPKESSWGFDEVKEVQYRRVDKYMTEFRTAINMNPGKEKPEFTTSFHRPLQYYFKLLKSSGFVVSNMHELVSNKESQSGKRSQTENRYRKEIPLFMTVVAIKFKLH